MNARRTLSIVLLLFVAALFAFHLEKNSRDPIVNGKRLSAWIGEFDIWRGPTAPGVTTLETSGASAEKLLTGMLRRRDSKLKLKFRELLSKQTWIKFSFRPAALVHEQALNTCNLLGPRVQGTAPAITALVMDYPQKAANSKTAFHALNTLAVMGTNGVRSLVHTLKHSDPAIRNRAAQLLGTLRDSGSDEVIRALQTMSKDSDAVVAQTAATSLELLKNRRTLPASSTDLMRATRPPGETPASVWDVTRGTRIVSTSPLYPGCRPEDLFGASLSSVGTPETGTAIFDDSAPDGFVHFVEWETPSVVTVRSFGLIGAHETALNGFIRAFRGFRLYARVEGAEKFSLLYEEDAPVPYGFGYCGSLLVRFRNLSSPVTARHFRVEFIQNGSGVYHGSRAIELYGFNAPLDAPLIGAALENQEPAIRDGARRALGDGQ